MAIGVLLLLTLALGGLGLVMGAVGDSGTPTGINPAAPTVQSDERDPGSPLGVLPVVAVATPVLGLAGAGMARVTRNRWRRAGVLQTLVNVRPGRRYLLEAAAVWLAVAGLIVLIVWALAGPQLGANVAQALAFFGVPVGATTLSLGFSNLYTWVLPRVSPVSAAAYARPIIEREAARQIKTERDFYGASRYDRTAYDRNRWADEILATESQGYFADAQRREDQARDIAQRSGAYSYGMSGPTAAGALRPHRGRRHAGHVVLHQPPPLDHDRGRARPGSKRPGPVPRRSHRPRHHLALRPLLRRPVTGDQSP